MLIVDIIKTRAFYDKKSNEIRSQSRGRLDAGIDVNCEKQSVLCHKFACFERRSRIATNRCLHAATIRNEMNNYCKWLFLHFVPIEPVSLASNTIFFLPSPTMWLVNSFEMNCVHYTGDLFSITYTQKCLSLNNVTKIRQKISSCFCATNNENFYKLSLYEKESKKIKVMWLISIHLKLSEKKCEFIIASERD